MSNPKLQLLDDFKKAAAMFPAFFKIAEELAQVGSIDQAAKEAQNRLDLLKADETKQRGASDAINAAAQAEAAQITKDAQTMAGQTAMQADQLLKQAQSNASSILAKAEAEAKASVARILNDADQAKASVAASNAESERLSQVIAQKRDEVASLNTFIDGAKSQHEDLKQHIADLKAKFAS